jgi:hypothetical protein
MAELAEVLAAMETVRREAMEQFLAPAAVAAVAALSLQAVAATAGLAA